MKNALVSAGITALFLAGATSVRAADSTTSLPQALPASDLAAIFAMLPVAQLLMIAFAAGRAENAGTPVRSTKITRSE